jgi:hypothetical protein
MVHPDPSNLHYFWITRQLYYDILEGQLRCHWWSICMWKQRYLDCILSGMLVTESTESASHVVLGDFGQQSTSGFRGGDIVVK